MYTEKVRAGLDAMRKQYSEPMSDMQLLREALVRQVAAANEVAMPPLLTEENRKIILADIDRMDGFLQSEDGQDAVELVMSSWSAYVAKCKADEAAKAAESEKAALPVEAPADASAQSPSPAASEAPSIPPESPSGYVAPSPPGTAG